MVLTAITNAEVAGKEARELTDEDVLGVLTSESKKRREAAEAFDDAGRDEQAAKERAEAAVIADYLPEQLSEDEIDALVTATIDELGVRDDGMRAMGRVMGALTTEDQGPCRRRGRGCDVRAQLGAGPEPVLAEASQLGSAPMTGYSVTVDPRLVRSPPRRAGLGDGARGVRRSRGVHRC